MAQTTYCRIELLSFSIYEFLPAHIRVQKSNLQITNEPFQHPCITAQPPCYYTRWWCNVANKPLNTTHQLEDSSLISNQLPCHGGLSNGSNALGSQTPHGDAGVLKQVYHDVDASELYDSLPDGSVVGDADEDLEGTHLTLKVI